MSENNLTSEEKKLLNILNDKNKLEDELTKENLKNSYLKDKLSLIKKKLKIKRSILESFNAKSFKHKKISKKQDKIKALSDNIDSLEQVLVDPTSNFKSLGKIYNDKAHKYVDSNFAPLKKLRKKCNKIKPFSSFRLLSPSTKFIIISKIIIFLVTNILTLKLTAWLLGDLSMIFSSGLALVCFLLLLPICNVIGSIVFDVFVSSLYDKLKDYNTKEIMYKLVEIINLGKDKIKKLQNDINDDMIKLTDKEFKGFDLEKTKEEINDLEIEVQNLKTNLALQNESIKKKENELNLQNCIIESKINSLPETSIIKKQLISENENDKNLTSNLVDETDNLHKKPKVIRKIRQNI